MTPPAWGRSLGARLATAYAAVFLVSAAGLFGLGYALLADSLRDRDRALIASEAGEFADALAEGDAALVRELADASAEPGAPAFAVRVVGADGRTRLALPRDAWARYPPGARRPVAAGRWGVVDGRDGALPLDVTARATPAGTLYVAAPAQREEVLARFRDLFALVLLPVLALGVGGGLVVARRALAPLRTLAATVERVASTGRLGERVPVRGSGDEIDALAGLVNGMLARVEALVGGMRGTLDAAAHDLRTPLTRLRAGAERALLDGTVPRDPVLSDVVEETDAVLAVLDAVMDVAEAEAGTLALRRAPTDLAALAAQVVDLYGLVAEEAGVALALAPGPPLVADVDAARVRQAVANLVDNAVKYTPAGGHVRVDVAAHGGVAVVAVDDDGPGVAEADRPRIWDRLYRGDASRSERGLGLGLSIVRAVAEAHGGAATVSARPAGGSRFALRLPQRVAAPVTDLSVL